MDKSVCFFKVKLLAIISNNSNTSNHTLNILL